MAKTKTKPVGRTPLKRQACEAWLEKQLIGRPWPARKILELASKLGWGWATVRRAKQNVGVQSFKKGNEWWWLDPKTCTPALASARVVVNHPADKVDKIWDKATPTERIDPVEQPKLPQALATLPTGAPPPQVFQSPQRATYDIPRPQKPLESRAEVSPRPVPPKTPEPVVHKPIEPLKPRIIHIWDSQLQEARDALISAARFADLYTMRADIWLRQEQLRAKGLSKEAAALNDLLLRVNEALENKKRDANIEANE